MRRRPAFLIGPNGQPVEIRERFVLGRAREADLVVNSPRVARHHLVFTRLLSGEVEAEDNASTNGTRLNGNPLTHQVLKHGDTLELDGFLYRFELGEPIESPVDPASALLAKAGDDEAAVQVVIDMLLEQGHPLGAKLSAGENVVLERVLQEAVDLGTLELTWCHGFIRTARVRRQTVPAMRDQLFALLSSEAGSVLDSLTAAELSPRFGLEGASMPALRTLRFGPFFTEDGAAHCRETMPRFPGAPFLKPPRVLQCSKPWLEFGAGQRRELDPGRQESFPTMAVSWERGGWRVARAGRSPALFVNGKSRFTAELLPDDVVSCGPMRFVFRAS